MTANDAAAPYARPSAVPSRPHVAAPIRTILLATDLGPASSRAVDEAIDLAQRLRAQVLVMSVIDPANLSLPNGRAVERVDQVRDERSRIAAAFAARGRAAGVPVRFLIWEGEPGEAILEAAAAENADMIVVGTHGRGGLGRLLLGSVSEHVIRHADLPVLVVRPKAIAS
jgi:nucleotide-binding universal stress UspA family protein